MLKIVKLMIWSLIFFMIVFNGKYTMIKYGLVGSLFLFSLFKLLFDKYYANKFIVKWFVLYICSGFLATIISLFNQNQGATAFITVTLFEPFIYLVFVIESKKHIETIKKALFNCTVVAISINLLCTVLINLGINTPNFLGVGANYGGVTGGFIKTSSSNIPMLMSLVPLYIALYSLEGRKKYLFLSVGGGLCAIITMRTAFILVMLFTPLIIFVLKIFCGIHTFKIRFTTNKLIAAIFIFVIFTFFISLKWSTFTHLTDAIINKIIVSFRDANYTNEYGVVDAGGSIRHQQIQDLLYTWKFKPLLGWGDGAEVLNSERAGYMYELSYFQVLMQRGLIGLSLYISCFSSIIYKGIQEFKRNQSNTHLFAAMVGLITILIANATNPYLMSFDQSYIIFWNLMLINQAIFKRNNIGVIKNNEHKVINCQHAGASNPI